MTLVLPQIKYEAIPPKDVGGSKAPAKRVQHFIQHHTTLMLYEMLHSFGHFVVSCCIMLCHKTLYNICCTLLYVV